MARGLAEVFSAALLAVLAVAAILALYTIADRALVAQEAAARAAASAYMVPRMELKPLNKACTGGVVKAELRVYSTIPAVKPLTAVLWDADTGRRIAAYSFNGSSTVIELPCEGGYVITVDTGYGVWVYSYDIDPSKPCLHGRIVTARGLLESCSTAAVLGEEVRKAILLASYGIRLVPSWVHGPLAPSLSPAEAVLAGAVPGYTTVPDYTAIDVLAGNVSSEASFITLHAHVAYKPYDVKAAYVRSAIIASGLLHIVHSEIIANLTADSSYPETWANISIVDGVVGYVSPVKHRASGYPGFYVFNDPYRLRLLSNGVVGSIYIPFLVTENSTARRLDIVVIPGYSDVRVDKYAVQLFASCPSLDAILHGTLVEKRRLDPNMYVSVKLHLVPVNSYTPRAIIVSRKYAELVASEWQSLTIPSEKTWVLLGPRKVTPASPVIVGVDVSPSYLEGYTAAVLVVEISYASTIALAGNESLPFSSWDSGLAGPAGVDILLYVSMEGLKGRSPSSDTGMALVVSTPTLAPDLGKLESAVQLSANENTRIFRGCMEALRVAMLRESMITPLAAYAVPANLTYILKPAQATLVKRYVECENLLKITLAVSIFDYYARIGQLTLVLG